MAAVDSLSDLTRRLEALRERLRQIQDEANLNDARRAQAASLSAQCDALHGKISAAGTAHPMREGLHEDWEALKHAFENWAGDVDARFSSKEPRGPY